MIPVIDLFAGPGGLGEGFSSLRDENDSPIFQTIMSVERDKQAHQTLRLRSYVRKIMQPDGMVPDVYLQYLQNRSDENWNALMAHRPELWDEANREAMCAELKDGDRSLVEEGKERLFEFLGGTDAPWVLIGGPPCQAYSLVGRSRRAHDATLEDDIKQTLYKCYLAFINELKPTAFIMENVKGLLSARRRGEGIFDLILSDMHDAGYEIRSLVKSDASDPRDFIVRAEEYGIPQARHRVILFGVKRDSAVPSDVLSPRPIITLGEVFRGIPKIRSGLSGHSHRQEGITWADYINTAIEHILSTEEGAELEPILRRVQQACLPEKMMDNEVTRDKGTYDAWYRWRLGTNPVLANHEARSHMASDIDRYLFCAAFAEKHGVAARLRDFPKSLYPNHQNVQGLKNEDSIKFDDRFRTQVLDHPSTTVTSHISKDGHYYIHPDPEQCRSLTVREAARLQTFPDDYLFEGNRTSQYTQVGNAVPPMLAQQIASIVAKYLGAEPHGFWEALESETGDGNSQQTLNDN